MTWRSMTWRSMGRTVLAGFLVAMVGCTGGRQAADQQTPVPEPVEPSVRHLAMDAPAGMSQAVVVQGFPLAHTRQLLPLDRDGTLVGSGSAEQQIGQVLDNLEAVLGATGSGLDKVVRLNVYADSPQTADQMREQLSQRLGGGPGPAITSVVSSLPHPDALVAADAVAIASPPDDSVRLQRCDAIAGDQDVADVAIMPRGGAVYLSGQPDKSPLPEAASKSLTTLLKVLDQLQLQPSQVVRLKAFVESPAAVDQVRSEAKRLFPGQLVPPIVFVQWIASAPIEIEMIASRPLTGARPAETVRYYTPSGVKPSPTFSRVALLETERQIYTSGLSARSAGDGESQVRDCFAQLQQILTETGSDLRQLAKATYYVSDEDASNMLNKVRPELFDPKRPPAASKAMVRGVGQPDRSVTMDMIATGSGEPSEPDQR